MYVVAILFVGLGLPIMCYKVRGCLWYEKRKEAQVRQLLKDRAWEDKNPEAAAKKRQAEKYAAEAKAAQNAPRGKGVTFRGDSGAAQPSSSALVAPMPPPQRQAPAPARQAQAPAAAVEMGVAGSAAAPPAPAPVQKGGAFGRMRNAFGGGQRTASPRMQATPLGGDAERGGAGAAAGGADANYEDDYSDESGSEYTESTFTGVTQSQTATSVGVSQPPPPPARGAGKVGFR